MSKLPIKLAVASCEVLPDWEVDDAPLLEILGQVTDLTIAAWSDHSVDWKKFDAVLLRTTWDYTERLAEFLDWVDRVSGDTLLVNSAAWVHWNSRKNYLADLSTAGVLIAPTHWIPQGKIFDLSQVLYAKDPEQQWFLKPQVGATSSHTLRFFGYEQGRAQEFLESLRSEHAFILQPYLKRVETDGEYSLLYLGGEFSHGVRKVPVPGDYRVQDDFGAHDEAFHPSAKLLDVANQALKVAAKVSGGGSPLLYARLDFLLDDNGGWLLNELEVIEPSLFFRHSPSAPQMLANALLELFA